MDQSSKPGMKPHVVLVFTVHLTCTCSKQFLKFFLRAARFCGIVFFIELLLCFFYELKVNVHVEICLCLKKNYIFFVLLVHVKLVIDCRVRCDLAQVSFSDHFCPASVCLSVCPSVNFYIFNFYSRTNEPISTKLGTKHPLVKGIQVS